MTLKSSAKAYLTLFLMTTCIYMVLYQYHLSGTQMIPEASTEIKVVPKYQSKDYRLLVKQHQLENHEEQQQLQELFQTSEDSKYSVLQEKTIRSNNEHLVLPIENTLDLTSPPSVSTKWLITSATPIANAVPPLYIITPTYKRPEQLAELTRLGYTLKHVSNLLWLVIEDSETPSQWVTDKLQHIGVPFLHLIAPMPQQYRKVKSMPRGVSNRNRGLEWLRANATDGVFYFADDDNTYDISIFEQMRHTKKISMWPVGLVTKLGVSSPIIRDGKLAGYYDGWIGGRKYPVDMAGFAVSIKFLLERPKAKMPFKAGYEEDGFLRSLLPFNNSEIELLASQCTEVLTWHTQTKKNPVAVPLNMTRYANTNLVALRKELVETN